MCIYNKGVDHLPSVFPHILFCLKANLSLLFSQFPKSVNEQYIVNLWTWSTVLKDQLFIFPENLF